MSDTTNGPGDDPNGTPAETVSRLASAYLDGEVGDDERQRVESSAELLAEVEALRQVRAVLGATTEPPPISVREAHLSAALDVWDRVVEVERVGDVTPGGSNRPAAAALTTAIGSSGRARHDRRSGATTTRWLLGAAAGFVVLAGTGLAISGLTRSDDSSDILADSAAEESAEEPVSEAEIVAAEAGDAFEGEEIEALPEVPEDAAFEEDLRPTASDEVDAGADTADTAQADAMEEEEDVESAVQAADADDSTGAGEAEPFPPEIDLDRLQTLEELEEFAATAAYAPVDLEAPEVEVDQPFETCDDEFAPSVTVDQYVGPALYLEEQVVVAIDDGNPPSVIAYRPADCVIVEQTRLPSREEYEANRNQP